MLVSQIAPYGTGSVGVTYLTPVKRTSQTVTTTVLAAPRPVETKPYKVELSGSAEARSLKLLGYTPQMISIKMGLDINTVNQYLGVVETTVKSTYVAPKAAYQEPKAITQGREQLAIDLNQLTLAQYTWSTMVGKL